jgi:excisionase family DNA binding protein
MVKIQCSLLKEQSVPNLLPDVMTIEETAKYLRIAKSSLYKLAQEGKIPCQKVGRHWRFRKESIDRWLEENRVNELEKGGNDHAISKG